MDRILNDLFGIILFSLIVMLWLAGTVLAAGWLKLIAIIFPPYAWYLCIERIMTLTGII